MSSYNEDDLASLTQLISQCFDGREEFFDRFTRNVSMFAECPSLLDSHLHAWLKVPIERIVDIVVCGRGIVDERSLAACRIFYLLGKVRGERVVAKFLPHDAHFLGCVAQFCNQLLPQNGWECLYTFLVWLGELVLVPFSLLQHQAVLVLCVEIGKRHLRSQGKPSEAAQLMLARLLTRPEFRDIELPSFLLWAVSLVQQQQQSDDPFIVPAVYAVIARIFTLGSRDSLVSVAPIVLPLCRETPGTPSIVRKMLVKMAQRVGLVFLPPRVAPWRYKRGHRVLLVNAGPIVSHDARAAEAIGSDDDDDDDNNNNAAAIDGISVPAQVDGIVHILLCGLRDRDTIVRWAAAKGIGRITDRLPRVFADLVVETVMELCSPAEEEHAWHGSCLALAELARRGLLLPRRLSDALPAVLEALSYDVKQGTRSVGSQVRDAACYVLWACARAYTPEVLLSSGSAAALAGSLLQTASLDREINCRRAASAAFQEHVGRLGLIKHGIDLVAVTDYFHLGSLNAAYQDVAWKICQYDEYRPWILEILLTRKISHWDVNVRNEAALLMGRIAPLYGATNLLGAALARLRRGCVSSEADCRHGSLIALGRCVSSLAASSCAGLLADLDLATIVPELEAGRLFRGKGGELVRLAACVFTQCLSESRTPMVLSAERLRAHLVAGRPDGQKTAAKRHKEFLDECLRHASLSVQQAAAAALTPFCQSYLCHLDIQVREAILCGYANLFSDPDPVVSFTRGAAMALGACPAAMFGDSSARLAVHVLCKNVTGGFPDAETRRLSVAALANLVDQKLSLDEASCIGALIHALRDYACDERGDVGSWVRETACARMTSFAVSLRWSLVQCDCCVGALLEIIAGRLDRPRWMAYQALQTLLRFQKCSNTNELLRTFPPALVVTKEEEEEDDDDEEEKKKKKKKKEQEEDEEEKKRNDGQQENVVVMDSSFWDRCAASLVVSLHRRTTLASLCTAAGVRSPDISARTALLRFLCTQPLPFLLNVWQDIANLLQERDSRLTPHLLFVVDFLIRNGVFDELFPNNAQSHPSIAVLRANASAVLLQCDSVSVLCSGIDVLCASLRFSYQALSCSRDYVVPFLLHPYPSVRQHAALQLHIQYQSFNCLLPDEAKRELISSLLLRAQEQSCSIGDLVSQLRHLLDA